jgi:hypothetical protein
MAINGDFLGALPMAVPVQDLAKLFVASGDHNGEHRLASPKPLTRDEMRHWFSNGTPCDALVTAGDGLGSSAAARRHIRLAAGSLQPPAPWSESAPGVPRRTLFGFGR